MSNLKRDRPTIGVLAGWAITTGKISDRYLVSIFRGIQSAARLKECHLLLAWGVGRIRSPSGASPAWPVLSPSSDFVPVGPWNTDGLIVIGSCIMSSVQPTSSNYESRDTRRSSYPQARKSPGFRSTTQGVFDRQSHTWLNMGIGRLPLLLGLLTVRVIVDPGYVLIMRPWPNLAWVRIPDW